MVISSVRPPGVILAGGLARRMGGGDKPLRAVAGRSILDRVVARLDPQCGGLLLNANGDPARFAGTGLPVIADGVPDFAGPLAGVLAALDWAATHRPEATHVLSAPGDAPFLPRDLVQRLAAALAAEGTMIACAASQGRTHPVAALWPVILREDLRAALVEEGLRKVGLWVSRHPASVVAWDTEPVDPFFNANTPEDVAAAESLAVAHPGL